MANRVSSYWLTKTALKTLNVFYMIVGIILISVGGYAKGKSVISSESIIGGIIASGVFLFLLSILGYIAAHKHHQILLFFYMVILGILFVIQFSVSIALLAVNSDQQHSALLTAWNQSSNSTRKDIQNSWKCCGFENSTETGIDCNADQLSNGPCYPILKDTVESSLKVSGAVGLVFAFFEVIGIIAAYFFRNQRNPKANPSAFL
eukprot:Colp12_sorted_trinity150504_noHs@18316